MTTRLISPANLNTALHGATKLTPKGWNAIKGLLRELGSEELKEIQTLNNPVANLLVMQILYERKAIII